jgi:hypothetical protein
MVATLHGKPTYQSNAERRLQAGPLSRYSQPKQAAGHEIQDLIVNDIGFRNRYLESPMFGIKFTAVELNEANRSVRFSAWRSATSSPKEKAYAQQRRLRSVPMHSA